MRRIAIPVLLALGAIVLTGDNASADDKVPMKSGFSGGAVSAPTMTLGGKGTPAAAASAPDTEQAWYHGYYRGYRRGFYNGYYAGYPAYYSGFYPAVYPYPYGVGYYPPAIGYYGRFGGVRVGVYGINGTSSDVSAPAVSLNLGGNINPLDLGSSPATPTPRTQPSTQPDPFRYDGGPSAPIPLPKQDAGPNGQATPPDQPNNGLPVSLPKKTTQPSKPYTYKGYGEK